MKKCQVESEVEALEFSAEKELTLRDLVVIYRRRRRVVYRVAIVLTVLALLYCLVAKRRYEASSIVQVQGKSQDALGLDSLAGTVPEAEMDPLTANINIQTQANILQSESLALKTIEDLHLEGTNDFQPHWNPVAWAVGLLSPGGNPDPAHASLEDSPVRRRRVLLVFERFLTVKPISGTRLIEIDYLNPDPKIAAAVVNKLSQALIDYSFQSRFDATNQASGWLNGQLNTLRQQSEDLQKQVADLESRSDVYTLGTVDAQGHEQTYSGVLDRLQQATTALNAAEQSRILRGAIAQAAEHGDAEMLSSLAGNAIVGGGATNNTLATIQNLRSQEATQQAALTQAQVKYGSGYPPLEEMKSNVESLHRSIQQEISRLRERAISDYQVAAKTEDATRIHYKDVKSQADALNNKAINFAILRQEADESRDLYQAVFKKFKEAGVLEGLKGSTITVVDPGRIAGKPKKPDVPIILGLAILGSFVLGCCIALLVDILDPRLNTVHEADRLTAGHLLGVMPLTGVKGRRFASGEVSPLASLEDPRAPFVEAVRGVRTAILQNGEKPSQVILVTSSVPGEGKTVLSTNLAILLAQAGRKVLLVDANLRGTGLNGALDLPARPGLAALLNGQAQAPEIHPYGAVPNLDVLQAGSTPANPSELLGSPGFAQWLSVWRGKYDHILLDSTSLLWFTDSLSLLPHSDVTLLVARQNLTERSQLSRAYQLLAGGGKHVVAAILNGLRPEEEGYSSYFASPKA